MPQRAVARPLGERDLADEDRLHPLRASPFRALRRIDERGLVGEIRVDPLAEIVQRLLVETGADLARVLEALAFVVADEQRAEAAVAPLAFGEAADHELLALAALDLQPRAAALGFVA